jgi:ubiquinone/menaquinone biosynthesis C-methylase UbiE
MNEEIIRADFDRIASLSDCQTDHNPYEKYLVAQLPRFCENALEVGCGTGAFTRLLAQRAGKVQALDLSPVMIQLAIKRSSDYRNIEFRVASITQTELAPAHFDCIVSIATIHHLPQEATLEKLKQGLKPGGTLLIHDLFAPDGLFDLAASGVALWANAGRQLIKHRRLRAPRALRAAWQEHGRHDTYLTLTQLRQLRNESLPGARIKRHLLWRYSLVWQKCS